MSSALIIIPTYNEASNIEKIIAEINTVLDSYRFSILVIDDNSSDGTKDILDNLKCKYVNFHVLNRKEKLGLASAYIDGFQFGLKNGYDYLIQMDADFSHNPEYLPVIIQKLTDYDVVIGSRNIKGGSVVGWGLLRNLISKGGSIYSKLILSCPIDDLTGGFNGWRSDIINNVLLKKIISKGYSFQIEMKYRAYKNNASILEIPIKFVNRKFGKSKMNKKIFLEALINILKFRFII